MTTHTTTIKLTAEEREAFIASLRRARESFSSIEGVISVGFGQKEIAGAFHDVIAITACVKEKKSLDALPSVERIPSTFEGYPTDVITVGEECAPLGCNNTTDYYPNIQGGIQIAPQIVQPGYAYDKGTLGCIVKQRGDSDRENVFLLTCKHVLYAGKAKENNYAYHPFAEEPHGTPQPGTWNALGPVQKLSFRDNVPYTPPGSTQSTQYYLDCATARINIDCVCCGSHCTKDKVKYSATIVDLDLGTNDPATTQDEANEITDVRSVIDVPEIFQEVVYKVGRSTGKTAGKVRVLALSKELATDPDYPDSPAMAMSVMRIDFDVTSTPNHVNCLGNERFAEGGDSGSVVVDANRRVIGLVAIGASKQSDAEPPPRAAPAYACHILPVLDMLKICIPTSGGTSHGSALATDGSGIKSVPPPLPANPTGKISFQTTGLQSASSHERAAFTPLEISAEEGARMLTYRDALVASPAGRELHDTFVRVRREIGYLVRKSRPVKVVWHRTHGPAWFAHTLNHLKGDNPSVPHEIDGVTRVDFLQRMGDALAAHGSSPMSDAIAQYRARLLPTLIVADDIGDCLRAIESLP